MLNQKMCKKTLAKIMLLMFIFMTLLSVVKLNTANAASDFVLTHSCSEWLSQGETFLLPINMRNMVAGTTIKDIELDFSGAGIATLTNGGTVVVLDSAVTVTPAEGDKQIANVSMRFTGNGSTGVMQVKVKYTLDDGSPTPPESTVQVSLVLNAEAPSTNNPDPVDTSKYKPNLVASVASTSTLTAGLENTVTVSLKNLSDSYAAKKVLITPKYDKTSPFVSTIVKTSTPVAEVKAGESTDIQLAIQVDKFTESGQYPFVFTVTYANAWNDQTTSEQTLYLKVENRNSESKLMLQVSAADKLGSAAGGTFTIPLYLMNPSSYAAKNIKVTLTGLSQDTFVLASGSGTFSFDKLEAKGNKQINVNMKAASALKTGSYPVNFKLEYTTEKGETVTDEQQVWVPVTGKDPESEKTPVIEVLEVTPSKTTVTATDTFNVTVKVKNSGDAKVDQLKVSADGTTALLPVSQNLYIVQSLTPQEVKTLTFSYQPSPDAKRGSVPIMIKVESVDAAKGISLSQAISVFVEAEDETKPEANKNVPKIIVKTYSSDPQLVKAGEKFTLNLEFLNTHSSKTIRNIKGNFTVTESSNETGNVFTPVDCSNTFYIDEISPKGTYDWTLTLYTIPDAKSKTYNVTINFEYEDDEGNPYKADEIIGIPVYQPSRFEISELQLPPDGYTGQPVYVQFQMYNLGKTDIYNVKMKVEGDFMAQPSSNYFGNFESGRQEFCELNLIPQAAGPNKGNLIITFENSSGEEQVFEKEFSMNIMEMNLGMEPGKDFPVDKPLDPQDEATKKGGFIGSVWFFVAIGAVVLAVIIIIVVSRKRKKSKEFEF